MTKRSGFLLHLGCSVSAPSAVSHHHRVNIHAFKHAAAQARQPERFVAKILLE